MTFLDDDEMVPIAIRRNRWIAMLVVLGVLAVGLWLTMRPPPPASPVEVELAPGATYLRTIPAEAEPARVVSLDELRVGPGDSVRLARVRPGGEDAAAEDAFVAVFSSSDSLAAPGEPHRVPGALDAGPDRITGRHPTRGWVTDIPEDFGFGGPDAGSVTVAVPEGARYLILGTEAPPASGDPEGGASPTIRIVPRAVSRGSAGG